MDTLTVDNPLYQAGNPASIRRVTVRRAMRDDPLARLHQARRIGDAQYRAARQLQGILEAAEVRGPRSVDPASESIGGRRVPNIMTDRQLRAIKQLERLYGLLGVIGKSLVLAVVMRGWMPEEYARRIGIADAREINSIGREFGRYLSLLAVEFGYA